MKHKIQQKNIQLQPEEKVLSVVRKHWFIIFASVLKISLIGLLPFVALPFIEYFLYGLLISINPAIYTFIIATWLLIIWVTIFTAWTNFYLDTWIVTDKRIVNINQLNLFRRDVSTLRIERVQDIKVEKRGFFPTLFNFGDIQIQTAGPEANYYSIDGIPKPGDVRNTIMGRVDMTTEHKTNYKYNKDQRPTDSE